MSVLHKCKNNRKLFGVCCGLSNSTGVDVSLLRIGFVIGTICTGSLLFWMYILMAIVLPTKQD